MANIKIDEEIEKLRTQLLEKEAAKQKKLEDEAKAEPLTEKATAKIQHKALLKAMTVSIDKMFKTGQLSIDCSTENLQLFIKNVMPKIPEEVQYEARHYFKSKLKRLTDNERSESLKKYLIAVGALKQNP